MKKTLAIPLFAILGLWGWSGCGKDPEPGGTEHGTPAVRTSETAAPVDPNAKPYPLKTCPVSGEELGKMGEPYRFSYKGQEIKLCCKSCEKEFNKEPDKYLKKLAAGAAK
jgi:YHS domain-containing protein